MRVLAAATGRGRRLLRLRLPGTTRLPRRANPAGRRRWDDGLSEFILPYEIVRTAEDPDEVLLAFLQSTYDAAATTARWDRDALDRQNGTDRHTDTCTHLDTIAHVTPSSYGCEDCVRIGGRWVHLRLS